MCEIIIVNYNLTNIVVTMGITDDAEGIEPELLEKAKSGETMMKNAVTADASATKLTNRGGGTGDDKSIDEVIKDSEKNLTKVRQTILQGGFTGPEKDKFDLNLAHAEWVHARNIERKCDNNIQQTSVKYTALVKGKAQTHEINKAYSDWKTTKETCNKISSDLLDKANNYIEVDRRVRENRKAANEFPVSISTTKQEPFQVISNNVQPGGISAGAGAGGGGGAGAGGGGGNVESDSDGEFEKFTSLKEGFDFYNGKSYEDNNFVQSKASGTTPAVMKYNVRLPQYDDTTRTTTVDNEGKTATILPWSEYYVDCDKTYTGENEIQAKIRCENANIKKNEYIKTINHEFDRADRLLNVLYNISIKGEFQGNPNYLKPEDVSALLENQKKNIELNKQNAIYDYDEYNSLSFYEDLVIFLYYAVFVIFVVLSLRDFFSEGGTYDKRNIIILILLGIYPKYILPVVLWILNGASQIAEMLGLKNVRFWKTSD
jgi:hypothetical protein